MEKVIATIVIIVLTLGLISYAVIGQMGGFRDTADIVNEEQGRLNLMVQNSSIVPLSTVKYYIKNADLLGYSVNVYDSEGKTAEITVFNESAMFQMEKRYNADGSVQAVNFTLASQA